MKYGLLAAGVVAVAACRPETKQANGPLEAMNAPQKPLTNPQPQKPVFGDASPQKPFPGDSSTLGPQAPLPGDSSPQRPLTNPQPQKPVLGDASRQPPLIGGTTGIGNVEMNAKQGAQGQQQGMEGQQQGDVGLYGEGQQNQQQGGAQQGNLSDAEIVAAMTAADRGEIQMAQLARKNATSPQVKNFAAWMISQHGNAQAKAKQLEAKANIQPQQSQLSQNLEQKTQKTISDLRGEKGNQFDRDYIDAQVQTHQNVLDMIDNQLIPSAQNDQLKAQLKSFRSHVADHLSRAKEIQNKLENPSTGSPGATSPQRDMGSGTDTSP